MEGAKANSITIAIATTAIGFASGCASLGPYSPLGPLEKKLIFMPAKYPAGNWNEPSIPVEDCNFESADGTKLHGWFIDHPQRRQVALFFHGNAGNVTICDDTMQVLHDRHRLSVLAFDYRGYGRSEGKPTEQGILDDARAARRWLAQRTSVAESDIVLLGQSLGGGVAIDLATDGARALIVSSTFKSLPEAAADVFPWTLPKLNMTLQMNSLEKIKRFQGPVLISHGDADTTINIEHGKALFDAAPGRKEFYTFKGGNHNDPLPEDYRVIFEKFIESLPTK
jgi:uncharacterized protein